MNNEKVGRAVNVILAEQRKNRRWLAKKADISYAYVSEFCRGTKMPSIKKLNDISKALGIELSSLLQRAEALPDLPKEKEDA